MTRKTINVSKVKDWANNCLGNDMLSIDEKKGIVHALCHVLHETGNYSGFGYIDSFDVNDPEFEVDGRKAWRRKYF